MTKQDVMSEACHLEQGIWDPGNIKPTVTHNTHTEDGWTDPPE